MTTPDPREIATRLIVDARSEIEFGSIGQVIDSRFPDLPDDETAFDKLRTEVDDLIEKAVVTVTWPEPEPEPLPEGVEVITVTIRTDDPSAGEHVKHLLEAESYDVDVTHG